jgi:nucleoid-associated protein YgaU
VHVVTVSPIEAAGRELAVAYLEVVEPPGTKVPRVPLKFNPTEYQLKKSNTFAEIAIPGLPSPPLQWIRGGAETLTMDVLVDTSDTLEDVRVKYVNGLRALLDPNDKLHAPPVVVFVWEKDVFRGVLESLTTSYVLFDPNGVPLRARLNLSMKEYRPVNVQVTEHRKSSFDVDKSWMTARGDTLSAIAGFVYKDPGLWRVLAEANGITDPRTLEPGRLLTIPRLA